MNFKKIFFLFFISLIIPLQLLSNTASAANEREGKQLDSVVATIPKSGTNFFIALFKELNIPVPVDHFFLGPKESIQITDKHKMRLPSDFKGKTVILVRDLHDVMPSTVSWLELIYQEALKQPNVYSQSHRAAIRKFLKATDEEKLLKVIELDRVCRTQMYNTKYACDLVVELLKKPKNSIFVVRFEDVIGREAGGYLNDGQRCQLIMKVCRFLGHPRSSKEVESALVNAFGKSRTYNPIKKKVGRWKDQFNEEHLAAFEEHWGAYNRAFGYAH